MENTERTARLHAYVCEKCFRRCLWVREGEPPSPPRCVCGEVLEAADWPEGLYEVIDAPRTRDAASAAREAREAAASEPDARTESSADIRPEADIGYGESHGYGPAHGGPTGPGDAPAGEPEE
jgi:hypothetical protein